MNVGAIGAIGQMAAPIMTPAINSVTTPTAPMGAEAASKVNDTSPMYLCSGPSPEANKLEDELMKTALLIGLLDNDDEDKKTNPLLDLIIAGAAIKMFEQMQAMGTSSAGGFVGNGAGGTVGITISVKA